MTSTHFHFPAQPVTAAAPALRQEVRAFLADYLPTWPAQTRAKSWVGFDRDFSLAVGARGWIGMTWPKVYGGQGRSALDRFVVLEEMLAVGAPIGAHSTGDRQTGPLLLRLGTEDQKADFLPRLARGEISVCVGLSEPDSGSDLASLRSRAEKVEGGWRLQGRKIWTTNAHLSEYMLGLFRTGAASERQAGLSQFIIDLSSPGIEIRGIRDLSGDVHFNEVTFDDAFVPATGLVGVEGQGWAQVTSELAFERSGPDRHMSAFPLLASLASLVDPRDPVAQRAVGDASAQLIVLREMSLSIAGALSRGDVPDREAAVLKELGVTFEQSIPEVVRAVLDGRSPHEVDPDLVALLQATVELAPTYSLRGGTREIMQGLVARGLGLR
ncbi:MAG: hypothetical protein JWR59_1243 [Brevundimonas sp.]|nr:hypothetical protein [Brevundimonas sp.]